MNKKIKEGLEMDMTTYKKVKGTLDPKTPIKITGDKPVPSLTEDGDTLEPEAVITPQDKATIKYLSNVKDAKTGKVSEPFTIGAQKYQMIRGITPSKEVVMAVFCHDETDENGENIIHPMDYFEENIANPMKEEMAMVGQNIQVVPKQESVESDEKDSDNFEGYKHYYVNRKTNEVRKFKSIKELVCNQKLEEEEYMGVSEFKQHMNEKMFGTRRKTDTLNEITPTGQETDDEMNVKAKKLMDMISKRIPETIIKTISTPIAQREVIAAFAELIGVPRNGLSSLISGLKDISKMADSQQAIAEKKIITKKQLEENLRAPKVIKTIKVKDIK